MILRLWRGSTNENTSVAYAGIKILFKQYLNIAENLALLYGIPISGQQELPGESLTRIPQGESWANFKNYPNTFVVSQILKKYFLPVSVSSEKESLEKLKKLFQYFSGRKNTFFAENETIESLLNKEIPVNSSFEHFARVDFSLQKLFAMNDCELIAKLNCFAVPTEPNRRFPFEECIEQLLKEVMRKISPSDYKVFESQKLQEIIAATGLQNSLLWLQRYKDLRFNVMIFSSTMLRTLALGVWEMQHLCGMIEAVALAREESLSKNGLIEESPAKLSTTRLRSMIKEILEPITNILLNFPTYQTYLKELLNSEAIQEVEKMLVSAQDDGKTKFDSVLRNMRQLESMYNAVDMITDLYLKGLQNIFKELDVDTNFNDAFLDRVNKCLIDIFPDTFKNIREIKETLKKILQIQSGPRSSADATPRKRSKSLSRITADTTVEEFPDISKFCRS